MRLLVAASLLFATTADSAPMFIPLGDLEGGDFHSGASAVSADGGVVVGESRSGAGLEAFRWTLAGGMVGLGDLEGGIVQGIAHAVSGDGAIIVGQGANDGAYPEATRFGPPVGLGDFEGGIHRSFALGVSNDGTIVGYGTIGGNLTQAYRWTAATGMIDLGTLPGGTSGFSAAYAITDDGSTIVGSAPNANGQSEAFRWTAETGMIGLGNIGTPESSSDALGVSADGMTIVGQAGGAFPDYHYEAFRWTSDSGITGLGNVPSGEFVSSSASGVSDDGSIVVGVGFFPEVPGAPYYEAFSAFIWDEANGMRRLDVALADLGLDLTGWALAKAEAISGDGRTIVGYGRNPNGDTEAWLVRISDSAVCDDGSDNDGDGYFDYPDDPECSSIVDQTEDPDLSCNVEMSQASYVNGEPVVITSLRFANQESSPVATRLRLQLKLPIGPGIVANAIDLGANGSFAVPASFDKQLGPVTMFTLGPQTPLRGDFEWRCALENPATGHVISEDRAGFTLQ